MHDARRVADKLGFKHFAFDRRELFEKEVVAPFVEEYLAGKTPSPCVRCNRGVKVAELIALADRLGASKVATGHYVKIVERETGGVDLYRADDLKKDQSYFLHMLPDATLARLMFPLARSISRPSGVKRWLSNCRVQKKAKARNSALCRRDATMN